VKDMSFTLGKTACTLALSWLLPASLPPPGADATLPESVIAIFGGVPYHSGSRIEASELSPDGKLLATLGRRSATVWDLATGLPLHRFFFDVAAWPGREDGLAFSPDGNRLACRPTSDRVVIWDLTNGKEVKRLAVEPVQSSAFSFCRFWRA
jgi:WD40 repeat protein